MILGLYLLFSALDTEFPQVPAQARERPFVQEPGEIIRPIRQQFAAADSYEQIEELALDALDGRICCCLRKRRMRDTERRRIAAQLRNLLQQGGVRRADQRRAVRASARPYRHAVESGTAASCVSR